MQWLPRIQSENNFEQSLGNIFTHTWVWKTYDSNLAQYAST